MNVNNLIDEWKIINESLDTKILKNEFYDDFDSFIKSLKWCNKDYVSNIDKIIVITNIQGKVTKKNKTLYIYQSPFNIKFKNMECPAGIMVENLIKSLINIITKISRSNIKVYNSKRKITEEEEEEDDDEEGGCNI